MRAPGTEYVFDRLFVTMARSYRSAIDTYDSVSCRGRYTSSDRT